MSQPAHCRFVLLALLVAPLASAWPLGGLLPGTHPVRPGLQFQGASVSCGYASLGLLIPQLSAGGIGGSSADYFCMGAGAVGYLRFGERGGTSLTYDASYVNRIRNSGISAFNQALNFHISWAVHPKWTTYVSASIADSTTDQMLLAPSILNRAANLPVTYDDLSAAILGGQINNRDLAAILSGAEGMEAASQTAIYGSRMLSARLGAGLSYRPSTRLSITLDVNARREQGLRNDLDQAAGQPNALLPQSTSGGAGVALSYALTQRTDIGASVTSMRVFSRLNSYYVTAIGGSLGRRLSRRWFGSVGGGIGVLTPIHGALSVPQQQTGYNVGASLGFKAAAHTLLAIYSSAVGDVYGFGARYTDSLTGAWNWSRPGRPWTLYASANRRRTRNRGPLGISGWQTNAGISRALNRHTSLILSHGYLRSRAVLGGPPQMLEGHVAQLTFAWTP